MASDSAGEARFVMTLGVMEARKVSKHIIDSSGKIEKGSPTTLDVETVVRWRGGKYKTGTKEGAEPAWVKEFVLPFDPESQASDQTLKLKVIDKTGLINEMPVGLLSLDLRTLYYGDVTSDAWYPLSSGEVSANGKSIEVPTNAELRLTFNVVERQPHASITYSNTSTAALIGKLPVPSKAKKLLGRALG